MDPDLSHPLAREFRRFAEVECETSVLYRRLASAVAEDPEILALAACAGSGQPEPNLLFAAVHFLLLGGAEHPLAGFYPTVAGKGAREGDPSPAFRAFCREQRPALAALLAQRRVQTNEVGRAAVLLPGLAWIAERSGGRALALIDVGASAGLLLLFDRYRYHYGSKKALGPPQSAVVIRCQTRGGLLPLPEEMPDVASRVGIDTHPISPRDPREALWLRGLVWGDQPERLRRLDAALALAVSEPPPLVSGNATELLPAILRDLPREVVPCVFHSHAFNQFSSDARERFVRVLEAGSEDRELYRLSFENNGSAHALSSSRFLNGRETDERQLADCQAHGGWIEWRQHPAAR